MSKSISILAEYQKGILLSEAVVRFAPEHLRRDYLTAYEHDKARGDAAVRARAQELRSDQIDSATSQSIARNLHIDLETLKADPTYMRAFPDDERLLNTHSKHHTEYVLAMQNSLIEAIRAGQFAAFGYQPHSDINGGPVRIPDDILRHHTWIDWVSSTIANDELKFTAVRLVPVDSLNDESKTSSRIGAPSKEGVCVKAYWCARNRKEIMPGDSKSTVIVAVEKIVRPPTTPKTIWKHVGPIHLGDQQQEESGNK